MLKSVEVLDREKPTRLLVRLGSRAPSFDLRVSHTDTQHLCLEGAIASHGAGRNMSSIFVGIVVGLGISACLSVHAVSAQS